MKHPREPLEHWEQSLHQELMELPELEAPPTLIPTVLHRIEASARLAGSHSSWWHWPVALRTVSVVLALAVVGLLGGLSGWLGELGLGHRLLQTGAGLQNALSSAWHTGGLELGPGAGFWNEHFQTILIAAAGLILAAYLTCVAAGTALYEVAWRRNR